MYKKIKILVAEQDKEIASITKNYLVSRGYSTVLCSNGEEALVFSRKERFDFALIDVNIPIVSGYDVVTEIKRTSSKMPVICLGAGTHLKEIKRAYSAGADEFLTRPFSMEELGMRIEAFFRWTKTNEKHQRIFTFGRYTLDPLHHVLIHDGKARRLTAKELDLLCLFCEHVNKVVERSLALQRIWNTENYFSARNMDVYIRRLRNMLCDDPDVKLENIHGVGYKLVVH